MEQLDQGIDFQKAKLLDLRERMVRTLGIHTVNVLLDRAIWEASQRHPELALIQRNDEVLSFVALEKAYAAKPEDAAAAFNDLSSELMLILARLLGREMAQRLAAELEVKMAREKESATGSG